MTIRYGKNTQRYLTLAPTAPAVPSALRLAAEGIPEDLIAEVELEAETRKVTASIIVIC